MDGEMLVASLVIPVGTEPDWEAGRREIQRLGQLPVDRWPQEFMANLTPEDPRENLAELLAYSLDDVQNSWEHEGGQIAVLAVGGYFVLVSGGISSEEDSPTALFDSMWNLKLSGVAKACGFVDGANCEACDSVVGPTNIPMVLCGDCLRHCSREIQTKYRNKVADSGPPSVKNWWPKE